MVFSIPIFPHAAPIDKIQIVPCLPKKKVDTTGDNHDLSQSQEDKSLHSSHFIQMYKIPYVHMA